MATNLKDRYMEALRREFPITHGDVDFFHKNTFDGDDEIDYINSTNIFRGKTWDQVDFKSLLTTPVEFLMLEKEGFIYYLPAFLKNFYELEYIETKFFGYFLSYMESGFTLPSLDEIEESTRNGTYKTKSNYELFERFTPSQSKLVAVFLVNVANLLPPNWGYANIAQTALTNYWGNFLLF